MFTNPPTSTLPPAETANASSGTGKQHSTTRDLLIQRVAQAQKNQLEKIHQFKQKALALQEECHATIQKAEETKRILAVNITPHYASVCAQSDEPTRQRLERHYQGMQKRQTQYQSRNESFIQLALLLDSVIQQCDTLSDPQCIPTQIALDEIKNSLTLCQAEHQRLDTQRAKTRYNQWHLATIALGQAVQRAKRHAAPLPTRPVPSAKSPQTLLCFSVRYRGSVLHDTEEQQVNHPYFMRTFNPALLECLSDLIGTNPATRVLLTINPAPTRGEDIEEDPTRQRLFEQLTTHFQQDNCALWVYSRLSEEAQLDELIDAQWAWRPAIRILNRLKELAKQYPHPQTKILFNVFDCEEAIIRYIDFFNLNPNCLPPQVRLYLHVYEKRPHEDEGITPILHTHRAWFARTCGDQQHALQTPRLFSNYGEIRPASPDSLIAAAEPPPSPKLKRKTSYKLAI